MMKHLRSCEANSKQNKPESITINEYFPPTTRLIPRKIKKRVFNAAV